MTRVREEDSTIADQAAEWFARLQEDEATEEEFREWQRWLNAAPEHAQAYREIERAWRLIGEVKPVPWTTHQKSQRTGGVRWALAAALLLSIVAGVSAYWLSARGTTYSTQIAEQRSIRLPDGSRVTLGARSSVTPTFTAETRRIRLDFGEAYFEVARDPARPFTVIAGRSEIRAVGTAFNVRSTSDRIVVSVTEGKVAVASRSSRSDSLLSAGEHAAITSGGAIEKAATRNAITWLQGRLEYQGETLSHVIDDLNRYTDRRIVLTDDALGGLRYSGTVFPDHLEEWLQGISGVLPVSVHDEGGRREISAAD